MTKTITDETLKSLDSILSEAADLTQSRELWERIKRVREELAALPHQEAYSLATGKPVTGAGGEPTEWKWIGGGGGGGGRGGISGVGQIVTAPPVSQPWFIPLGCESDPALLDAIKKPVIR